MIFAGLTTNPSGAWTTQAARNLFLNHTDQLTGARTHGIHDDDMLHAYRHPIRVFELDDLTIAIGPDQAARLLEVGVAEAEGVDFIVHAMAARPKYLET